MWTAWLLKAERFAFDQLELRPWEFWQLTAAQYNLLVDAYYHRIRRKREVEASWICTLINHYPMRGKNSKSLRVDQLVGPSPETVKALKAKARRARGNKPS